MTQLQIECFLAAVRAGSISGAARELYLSTQVVSQHILNLEQELNLHLFSRSSSGVELTQDGEHFLAFSSRLSGLYYNTMTAIREKYRNLSRRLSIGLSDYIDTTGPISGGLTGFARLHPEVDIRGLQYSNRTIMEAVSQGEIDVAIMIDSQIFVGGDFDIYPFAREDLRLFVSHAPELPETCTASEAMELCGHMPHIDTPYGQWSSEEWEEISRRKCARLGFQYTRHHILPNFRSVVTTVDRTPSSAVCDARFGFLHDNPELKSFPFPSDSQLCAVSNRGNENPLIQDFREYLRSYYA